MSDEDKTPAPAPAEPEVKPEPTPEAKPEGEGAKDTEKDQLKSQLETLQAELAGLKSADEARKKAEDEKNKTLEEKLATREQELKTFQRKVLIEQVRRQGGFTAPVFDAVTPDGEDEAAIKKAYESFKTSLDEYTKQAAPKGQGGGTEGKGGKPEPSAKLDPVLVRLGIVGKSSSAAV